MQDLEGGTTGQNLIDELVAKLEGLGLPADLGYYDLMDQADMEEGRDFPATPENKYDGFSAVSNIIAHIENACETALRPDQIQDIQDAAADMRWRPPEEVPDKFWEEVGPVFSESFFNPNYDVPLPEDRVRYIRQKIRALTEKDG